MSRESSKSGTPRKNKQKFAKLVIMAIIETWYLPPQTHTKMTIQEMIQSLNPHQLAYVNLDLEDPKNGEYMLCVFHLIP